MEISRNAREMMFEKNRLRTFNKWIYNNKSNVKCTAVKMAKAGFYMTSKDDIDSAKCFVCMKMLTGWESEDDPFEEHKLHARMCPFVKLNKDDGDLTLREFITLCEQYDCNLLEESSQRNLKDFHDIREKLVAKLRRAEKKNKNFPI